MNEIEIRKNLILEKITDYVLYAICIGHLPPIGGHGFSVGVGHLSDKVRLFYGADAIKDSFREYPERIFFYDFKKGYVGDVFYFYSLYYKVAIEVAIDMIEMEIEKEEFINNEAISKIEKPISKGICEINVKTKRFTEKGLQYWAKYGISLNTLNFFEVYELDFWTLNGKVQYCKYLSFTYKSQEATFKILQLDPNPIYKWRNSHNYEYVEGLEQLLEYAATFSFRFIIITKALKECMFYYEQMKIPAISSKGETQILSPHVVTALLSNYQYVILYVDNDKTGYKLAKKYRDEYKGKIITIFNPKYKNVTDMYEIAEDKQLAINYIFEQIDTAITNYEE